MKALAEILAPLVAIADAYDANDLDDEARKHWGRDGLEGWQFTNDTPPERIELYTGRGGNRLLTLADCLAAREWLRSVKPGAVQIDLSAAGDTPPLKFTYTNYKGETADRTVTPQRLFFGEMPYHNGPQWFLDAFCHDKRARRTFAFNDIRLNGERVKMQRLAVSFSNVLRHAFFAGAGYGDLEKISPEDQKRWVDFDPPMVGSFKKMFELFGLISDGPTADDWITVPGDFVSHIDVWRNALVEAKVAAANTPSEDSDANETYWQHQIDVLDKIAEAVGPLK